MGVHMFQKIFGFLVFLFLVSIPGFCQIQLIPPSHDFGEVQAGKEYACKVKIVNNLAKTVTLSAPSVSSKCGAVALQKNVLPPKAFTWMTFRYNPDATPTGPQFLNAAFNASFKGKNGGVEGVESDFQMKAFIRPYYTLAPAILMASYLNGQKAATLAGQLVVDGKACPDWSLIKSESDSNTFTAKVVPLSTTRAYSIQLNIPGGLPIGTYGGQISIKGRGKTAPNIQYPYRIIINSLYVMDPPVLQLGPLDPKTAKTWKSVTLLHRIDGKPFKIEKIEGAPVWLKYGIQKNTTGLGYTLHWTMDDGELADKKEKGKPLPKALTLTTDSPVEKAITLNMAPPHGQSEVLPKPNSSKSSGGTKNTISSSIKWPFKTTPTPSPAKSSQTNTP
jgi:hypothetical protein